jgi:trimethylamine:corrinoid methyltransferase-like protein
MHHFMRGLEVSEDKLCLDLIHQQGPGGNFQATELSFEHYKEAFFFPILSDRSAHARHDSVDEARNEVDSIIARNPLYTRDAAICAEIDRLYALAKEKCRLF